MVPGRKLFLLPMTEMDYSELRFCKSRSCANDAGCTAGETCINIAPETNVGSCTTSKPKSSIRAFHLQRLTYISSLFLSQTRLPLSLHLPAHPAATAGWLAGTTHGPKQDYDPYSSCDPCSAGVSCFFGALGSASSSSLVP